MKLQFRMGLYVSQNKDSESICSDFNETIFLPESQYQGGQIENSKIRTFFIKITKRSEFF